MYDLWEEKVVFHRADIYPTNPTFTVRGYFAMIRNNGIIKHVVISSQFLLAKSETIKLKRWFLWVNH